jgi:hypothetical protein
MEIRYIDSQDQTLILKEVQGRMWACHWAGRPSKEKVQASMSRGEVVFLPYNVTTGEYLLIAGAGRRYRR